MNTTTRCRPFSFPHSTFDVRRSTFSLFTAVLLCLTSCQTPTNISTVGGPSLSAKTTEQVSVAGEKTYEVAFNLFDAFVHLEYENRDALARISPAIHVEAQRIRRHGRDWIKTMQRLTDAFQANPTPENRAGMQQAAQVVAEAVAQVSNYMAQANTKGIN